MRYIRSVAVCSLAVSLATFLIPLSSQAHLPAEINGRPTVSLAPMLANVTPAVVNISVEKMIPGTPGDAAMNGEAPKPATKALAVGSGVIIDTKAGYIATNAHIVKNQEVMVVTLKDGRRYRAKLVGSDDGFDVAVIQISAKNLTLMPIGNSGDLKVGDFVVAVGSPFGLSQTVTSGVISALNRATPKIEGFQDFIQTDAPINPGNSGGALINMKGQFIGMNTAILAPSEGNIGIGFAIPSNMVQIVAEQLIRYGKVSAGMLGVVAQNITPELADAMHLPNDKGVVVTQVVPGSPAELAGIKAEDAIVQVDNNPIADSAQLHNLMGTTHPGTKIHLAVLRSGKPTQLLATIGNPKDQLKQKLIPYLSGLRLQNFSDLEPDSSEIKGVLVLDISDNSAGALAGLLPTDIIIKANGQAVQSVKDLISIAENSGKQLLLKIIRGNNNLFLVIQPDQ